MELLGKHMHLWVSLRRLAAGIKRDILSLAKFGKSENIKLITELKKLIRIVKGEKA
jgi:hypothetical protein